MTTLQEGDTASGFHIISVHPLPEIRATGVWARHERTGFELYHVVCDDPENLAAVSFFTLPRDSTGVAHILEHTVLCGSEKYPVKDPFLLLLKGSMSTFLNAFTFPDKTVYPAASTVDKDLFNILEVYGDAVFFPLLRKEFFQQEGHRLVLSEDGSLALSGVVFNEMKGNYSTQEGIEGDWSYRALLPDTAYAFDSGGDPECIPSLSYEAFRAFHETYYHPSNAKAFVYGDIPTERYLEFYETRFLSRFEKGQGDFQVAPQIRWSEPREHVAYYPVAADDTVTDKTSVTMNWLLDPVHDPERTLELELLAEVLLGSSASPLYRVIVESDLGEDLSSTSGIETELAEVVFSVGMRGTNPESKEAVEELILNELRRLVREGIDAQLLEGALRKLEFRNRELKTGSSFGLRLMRRSLRGWMNGARPEATMLFTPYVEALRSRLAQDPRLLESVIQDRLLANNHRATVVVRPDPELSARRAADERQFLATKEAELTDADREQIQQEQAALAAAQGTPDDPAAVAGIPFLERSDVPRDIIRIPMTHTQLAGVPVFYHESFTNDIVYLDFAFNLQGLTEEQLQILPVLAEALTECGLVDMSYDELARQIDLVSGGIHSGLEVGSILTPDGDPRPDGAYGRYFTLRIKALEHSLSEALDLLSRMLREADVRPGRRLSDVVSESRNDMRSSIIPAGHTYAGLRAARSFSPSLALEERWRGITHLFDLTAFANDIEAVSTRLAGLAAEIFTRARTQLSLVCSETAYPAVASTLERFLLSLPEGRLPGNIDTTYGNFPTLEALSAPADVSYVGAALAGAGSGSSDYAAEIVL
ncbi:MAG: insulinase family protein, partial [Spirochaeta sp.]|nr:insulinase family protein [Spirochaeta sp.]